MPKEFDIYWLNGNRITYIQCKECDRDIECMVDCDVMPQGKDFDNSNSRGDFPIIPDVCPYCGEAPVFDCGTTNFPEDFHSDG